MRGQGRLIAGVFLAAVALGVALSLTRPSNGRVVQAPSPTITVPPAPTSTATAEPTPTDTVSPTSTVSLVPSPSPSEERPTNTLTTASTETTTPAETATPTTEPAPPTSPPATRWPTTIPRAGGLVVGGIDFAASSQPLTIAYPTDWDRADWLTLEQVGILLSDATGESLRIFDDIGSWRPGHRIFVYADGPTGVPILSIHDGYWARQPLEAEPLRALIEGTVASPYAIATIEASLERLQGHPLVFGQGDQEARLVVRRAVRMDAETTSAYLYRPAYLSERFPDGEVTSDTLIVMICSARQPNEPNETFPARFLLLLGLEGG